MIPQKRNRHRRIHLHPHNFIVKRIKRRLPRTGTRRARTQRRRKHETGRLGRPRRRRKTAPPAWIGERPIARVIDRVGVHGSRGEGGVDMERKGRSWENDDRGDRREKMARRGKEADFIIGKRDREMNDKKKWAVGGGFKGGKQGGYSNKDRRNVGGPVDERVWVTCSCDGPLPVLLPRFITMWKVSMNQRR